MATTKTPSNLSNQTPENANRGSDNPNTNEASIANTNLVENNSSDETDKSIELPYQKKARRKSIKFPDDCERAVVEGSKNWKVRRACGIALYNIQPDLPKADCAYDLIERDINSRLEGYSSIKFYSLATNKYLVEVLCRTAAYNIDNVYLLYDESSIPAKARVLEFPWIKPDDDIFKEFSDLNPPTDDYIAKHIKPESVKIIGGRYFDTKTGKLIVFDKGRGIGDFGQYARYSFVDGKAKLEELRAKYYYEKDSRSYQLNDVIKHPPKNWKRYYPK